MPIIRVVVAVADLFLLSLVECMCVLLLAQTVQSFLIQIYITIDPIPLVVPSLADLNYNRFKKIAAIRSKQIEALKIKTEQINLEKLSVNVNRASSVVTYIFYLLLIVTLDV